MKIERVARCDRPGSAFVLGIHAKAKLLSLGILLCAFTSPIAAAQANAKNVLLLFSFFDRNHWTLDNLESSLRAHAPWPVNFSLSYLENARIDEQPYRESLAETLRHEYAGAKLDLIVVSSEPALRFAIEYRDKIFPGVPIVFWAISSNLADQKMPGVTGVAEPAGIRETIDLALGLHPDTSAVAVVTNVSQIERDWLAEVHAELLRDQDKVKEIDLVGPPGAEMLERVGALPPHTVILFQLFPEDSTQRVIGSLDVLAAAARRFPTYSIFPTLALNHGGIGGAYYDDTKDAAIAGELSARVLLGERPDDIPVVHIPSLQVRVDWRQLRRWHIPESALPPGSEVLYREPTAWESYKWYIIGGLSLIALEGALIIALMWQSARRRRTESELALTYDRLRMAVDAGKSVGWDTDFRNGRNRWFGDLQTLFGIQADSHNGHMGDFRSHVHPDDLGAYETAIAEARERRGPYAAEFRVVRKDGDLRWISAKGKFYFTPNGETERMLGMATDITERKSAEEALKGLSGQLIQAQEAERSRIAREIHDDYQQRLAMLSIDLEDLAQYLERDSEGSDRLHELWDRVGELGSDLHSLSHRLHSSTLDNLGLVAALRSLCEEFRAYHSINVNFVEEHMPRDIPKELELCLFRIAQEALQNVKKHSRSDSAEVRAEGLEQKVHLSISDRGTGFDRGAASRQSGIGIRSMEERVRLVGGQFTVHSRPMEGTKIDVWVPIGS
jgi:PAS domain S-box-containing protein